MPKQGHHPASLANLKLGAKPAPPPPPPPPPEPVEPVEPEPKPRSPYARDHPNSVAQWFKPGDKSHPTYGDHSKKAAAERKRMGELVMTQPQQVILELFEASARATTKLLKKWERSGAEPSRNLIDATKECRQLAVEAYDVYKATAGAAHAEQFFATMDARLEAVAAVLEEHAREFEPAAS